MAHKKFKCACGTTDRKTGKDAEKIMFSKQKKKPYKKGRK